MTKNVCTNEIWELLNRFFCAYLRERNLEKALDCVSESVIIVGTGVREIAFGKEGFLDLLTREFKQQPAPMDYAMEEYCAKEHGDAAACAFAHMKIRMPEKDGIDVEMDTRLTASMIREDGRWKIAEMHLSTSTSIQGEEEFFPLKFSRNVKSSLSPQESRELINVLTGIIPGGIIGGYLEPGFPLYVVNDAMLKALEYTYEELAETYGERLIRMIHPEDREMVEKTIMDSVEKAGTYTIQYRLITKSGKILWVYDQGKKIITDEGRSAFISVMTDISNNMMMQSRLKKEAGLDPLTGILNRREAIHQIELSMIRGEEGILFFIDIDNFKKVNDTYGHRAGDEVLIRLAELLKENARSQDVVARMGGDEFLIYYIGLTDLKVVKRKASMIQEEFRARMCQRSPEIMASVSMGICRRGHGESFESMYQRADRYLYKAKLEGKGMFHISDQE